MGNGRMVIKCDVIDVPGSMKIVSYERTEKVTGGRVVSLIENAVGIMNMDDVDDMRIIQPSRMVIKDENTVYLTIREHQKSTLESLFSDGKAYIQVV
jgi:hypothetical protein